MSSRTELNFQGSNVDRGSHISVGIDNTYCQTYCFNLLISISGTLLTVALGVIFLAILLSIMVVNWAKLMRKKYVSENMVLLALIVVNGSGFLCVWILGFCRLSENGHTIRQDTNIKITFIKIKLFSMYFFGSCYLFHCGLYAWMHSCFNFSENHTLGLIFNLLTMFYVFFLFGYFSLNYNKMYENTPLEKLLILGVFISIGCIWMDTVFSESSDLFETVIDTNISTVENLTESVSIPVEFIEITDPFLLPAMIEFSLMAIDLLFSKEREAPKNGNINEKKRYTTWLQSVSQLVIYICCFALFSFTFYVLVTDTAKENVKHTFDKYVEFQIFLKIVALFLVFGCTNLVCKLLKFHLNASAIILVISCFGNVVYHTLYLIASVSTDEIMPGPCVDNAISILMAGFQVYFILGTHCLELPTSEKDILIHCACSLLSMINFGLWISDSIGEERRPVFSIVLSDVYGEFVWKVINKLILPLTIFFRFHSGVHFLELYWECRFLPAEYIYDV